VASAATFSDVKLGPHEAKLRKMINSKDPGLADEYTVYAIALVDKAGAPNWRIMAPPFRARFEGHIVYQTIFGGCMWVYKVSKHKSPLMSSVALQPSGFLWVIPERWENSAVLQDASKVLQRATC
jgi:hypothetical protein